MKYAVRIAALSALALLLLAAPAPASAPRLTEAAGARFPDRAYALTLPRPAALEPGEVTVRENGEPVADVEVLPPERLGGRRFGVVLAIDTSGSMRGLPLAKAKRAALSFVAHRRPDQPVALVTFAGEIRVLQPFTTDGAALERALSTIATAPGGSRILDATAEAVGLIRSAAMTSGSAVILSDGSDYESRATVDEVTDAARDAGARVYSIGLRSGGVDFGTLNLLAAGTNGEFSPASSLRDLARVYARLGSQLAHQYLVRYRSEAAPGRRVEVAVEVTGIDGVAAASYHTPALAVDAGEPFHHPPLEGFWTNPGAALLIAAVVAALLALAFWALLRPRGGSLRERMAAFVAPPAQEDDDGEGGAITGRLMKGAERSLEGRAWWAGFKERMDVARIEISPVRLLILVATCTLLALVLLPLVFGNPAFALLALAVPVGAKTVVERRAARQRKLFGEQLPDNLQVIASAMRAGHSFSGALSVVVDDAPQPTRRELERVVADDRLGVPLNAALGTVVRRMASKDLEQVALVAALQRETGGNTAEVLDRVTETVRERIALQRLINSLTAQGRMSRWVLTALPCLLLAVISAVNPAYVEPLFATTTGRILLGLAAGMVCAGSFVIKKIVDIRV